ncbi:MAG: serine/threonine-protein kinase [Kofleriaceae bacterium]
MVGRLRDDLLARELASGPDECVLVFGVAEVHGERTLHRDPVLGCRCGRSARFRHVATRVADRRRWSRRGVARLARRPARGGQATSHAPGAARGGARAVRDRATARDRAAASSRRRPRNRPGTVEGRPYVALELAPGDDLRRIVAPPASRETASPGQVRLPRARALSIVRGACDAVHHLHDHGWVHGDVNPGNLIVDGTAVMLIDLGVARRIGDGGAVRGTHAYMAPEQVRGEAWTAATDVFALGVLLWELVAGARLFHRGPPWLSMSAVVEAPVPALSDAMLDAIAQAALAKDPTQRIGSAAELAIRLCD